MFKSAALAAAVLATANAEVYFKETFDGNWEDRWVISNNKKDAGTAGKFEVTAGKWYGDEEADKGLQTSQDARFYATSAKFDKLFDNTDKDMVIQFAVKHEQKIDCGGGYIKVAGPELDQENFNGDSAYNVMFGPDICGGTKRVHVIFSYKGENHLIKKTIPCETDQLSHVYTLIVRPDQTYEVRIDGEKKESGDFLADWDFLPPKMIKDPELSKPEDWVDEAMIADPEDVKPEGYDDIPKTIEDPDAEMPEDWDEEDDGEWEAPIIPNPEYKGPWKARMIDNPDYKGPWVHPEIENPDFEEDNSIYAYESEFVGLDLWQVKSGSIFDNFIITDSVEEAEEFMAETFGKNKDGEKAMFDKVEEARKAAEEEERKRLEEERKAAEEEEEYDEEEEEYDEEEEEEEEEAGHDEL